MTACIETYQESNGSWVASVEAVPGLQVFGRSREETLAIAEELATIFLPKPQEHGSRILGFYPGRIPDSAQASRHPFVAPLHNQGNGQSVQQSQSWWPQP